MSKKLLAAFAAAAIFAATTQSPAGETAGTMTNDDVVTMVQANLAPGDIINRIKDAGNNFDLSTNAVIALKENGVPDEVLAAMLVSSSRAPSLDGPPPIRPGSVSSLSGNLPARNFAAAGGGNAFPAGEIGPPNLPGMDLATGDFPGMEALDLPGLPADALAGGLPSLPVGSPGDMSVTAEATAIATPMPARPELAAPVPIQGGDFLDASGPSGFSLPPVDFVDSGNDFYAEPVPSAVSAAPAPQSGDSADDGAYKEVEARFQKEIADVMADTPEKKTSAVAWMLANQQYTLDLLRETMIKANRPEMEAAAVYSLGRLRDSEAIPEIRKRLVNRNRIVRENAAEALAYMEDTDAIAAAEKALTQRVDPMDGLIRLVGHARLVRASDSLGKILSGSSTPANRVAAAWALTQIGRAGTAAWPAVKRAMTSDSNAEVRRQAVRAVSSYHDDKESAKLLESACRKDPEVRKAALEELADYPESIPFLITVMNLKPDQIAADELETARATLFKLTGEDFTLDGPRWRKWLTENRSRLGLPLPPGEASGDGQIPPGMKKGPAYLAGGRPRQVDVRSWGIVADPMEIPLAPEVDDGPANPRAGAMAGRGGGSLPIPPPGLAGGPAGLRGPDMYDEEEDYGPPPGGMFGGGGFGGLGGGMSPPPGAGAGMGAGAGGGYAGGYDDDEDYGGPPSGGGALPGMRLPLPSGLMGSSSDDAPPIPVGLGSRSAGGSSGFSGMSGIGGGASEAYETSGSSFGGGMDSYSGYSGGYDTGTSLDSTGYGSTDSYSSSYDSGSYYGGGITNTYQSSDPIILPPTEYAPISVDSYAQTDIIGDDSLPTVKAESTGDLVPNLPIETTVIMDGSDGWADSSSMTGSFSGATDAGGFDSGYDFEEGADFDSDEFSESFGGVPSGIPAPPGGTATALPVPPAGGPEVINFPGDQSTFGLGEPLFNEYGQPNGAEAMELPASRGAVPGMVPPPGGGRIETSSMQGQTEEFDEFDDEFDDFESSEFDDFDQTAAGEGYDFDGGGAGAYVTTNDVTQSAAAGGADGFDEFDFAEGEEFDDGYAVEAAEIAPPNPFGASATVVATPSDDSSPPASTLNLPSRRRRKQHGESAIVSHTDPEVSGATLVGSGAAAERMPSAVVETGVSPYERQAQQQGDSVVVTGPFRILDEEGRTTAIVMNSDDLLLPPTANETDMYVRVDEPDMPIEARELPPPAAAVVLPPPQQPVSVGVTVEASPSQTPGRNFRPKK